MASLCKRVILCMQQVFIPFELCLLGAGALGMATTGFGLSHGVQYFSYTTRRLGERVLRARQSLGFVLGITVLRILQYADLDTNETTEATTILNRSSLSPGWPSLPLRSAHQKTEQRQ